MWINILLEDINRNMGILRRDLRVLSSVQKGTGEYK